MSRWFRSAVKATPPMTAEAEEQHLHSVENALLKLLSDEVDTANKILNQHDSAFHYLGRGLSSFISSMLLAEKESLKEAAASLHKAESKSWDDMKRAQKETTAFRSEIYPPGTEYLLCYAIAQLTSAITAVLSGSVTQAVSGFYKLRKAFLTLDGIMEIETSYFKRKGLSKQTSMASRRDTLNSLKTREPSHTQSMNSRTSRFSGEVVNEKEGKPVSEQSDEPSIRSRNSAADSHTIGDPDSTAPIIPTRTKSNVLEADPESLGLTYATDIFIHSGVRLCYGLLLVVFSMIENPIFNKILYIVGFKGDRERGTRYLWQASRFNNFNSSLAGICLLGYYNGLVGFCDILPTDSDAANDLSGYPKVRCEALLSTMIDKYPTSRLWKLEEARMLAYNHDLGSAVKILNENCAGNMKQIDMIIMFERSFCWMGYHDYEECAKSWIEVADQSSWSPCLYAYMTGAAFLELYRNVRESDPAKAKEWKGKAAEYLLKAPPLAGQQKVMSKPLPFDVYIARKMQKYEERAKAWDVDLVDAIGTSPLAEMMYLWNGIKKMAPEQLQKTLDILQWERTLQPEKHKADLDDTATTSVIRASVLRNLGKYKEARSILQNEVLVHDRSLFRGHLKDDWALPIAHYEIAALCWVEKDLPGTSPKEEEKKVLECEQWLQKTQRWGESYVLDTRMSAKISTALYTVKRHRGIMGF